MLKIILAVLALAWTAASAKAQPNSVLLEDLTWTEVRDAVRAGRTTAIIPVGGVEQSGPAMALGKHDVRVRLLAERIAQNLGNALVAPVVAYVPETPEHQRFPGTISVPSTAFRQILTSAAESLRRAGFRHVVLIGDHGGYQADLEAVANGLARAWAGTPAQAHYVGAYYRATQTAYVGALRRRGFPAAEIGTHAGLADTSLSLALDPRLVRRDRLAEAHGPALGVHGDPRRASAELGRLGVDEIVRQSVAAIRAAAPAPSRAP